MNSIAPYAIVINFTQKRVLGKIGPFNDWKGVHDWCVFFRKKARSEEVDMTAISGEVLEQVSSQISEATFLPSKEPEEIIRHVTATALFGIPV